MTQQSAFCRLVEFKHWLANTAFFLSSTPMAGMQLWIHARVKLFTRPFSCSCWLHLFYWRVWKQTSPSSHSKASCLHVVQRPLLLPHLHDPYYRHSRFPLIVGVLLILLLHMFSSRQWPHAICEGEFLWLILVHWCYSEAPCGRIHSHVSGAPRFSSSCMLNTRSLFLATAQKSAPNQKFFYTSVLY